jgi:hypothetical protein
MTLQHVMLDNETLGTRADSVIISIGAVKFDPYTSALDADGFYSSVSIDSNHEAGPRQVSEATLNWWMGQSAAARRVFIEEKFTLRYALEQLASFINDPDIEVWSNGASFDIALLEHAFDSFGIECPWSYRNTRCYRTIRKMAHRLVTPLPQNDNHHALADARHQARQLQHYFAALQGQAGQLQGAA